MLCPWNSVEQPEIYVSDSASFCRCLAFNSVHRRPITCRRACAGFAHLHGGPRDILGRMRKWTVSTGVRRDELSSELVQSLNGRLRACARIWPSDLGGDTQHSVKRESIHAWSELIVRFIAMRTAHDGEAGPTSCHFTDVISMEDIREGSEAALPELSAQLGERVVDNEGFASHYTINNKTQRNRQNRLPTS